MALQLLNVYKPQDKGLVVTGVEVFGGEEGWRQFEINTAAMSGG